jgi:hypothetical protein
MQSIQILMMSSDSETLLSPIVNGCLSSGVKIVYTVYIHRPKSNQMCALIYEEEEKSPLSTCSKFNPAGFEEEHL